MVADDNDMNSTDIFSEGLPVPLKKIIEAMEIQSDSFTFYLSMASGKMVMVTDEACGAIEEGEKIDPATGEPLDEVREAISSDDYIPIPDQFEIDEYRMMERFARSVPDRKTSEALSISLQGSGAFRRFKDMIWILDVAEDWFEFRDREYAEIAITWCEEHKIEYQR